MHRSRKGRRSFAAAAVALVALAIPATALGHGYRQTNLVSDQPGVA